MTSLPNNFNEQSRSSRERRRIVSTTARTSTLAIYEVPQGKRLEVESLTLCNTSALTVTCRVHHLAPGESASVSNAIYYDLVFRQNTTVLDDSKRYFNAGDRIAVQASTAGVLCVSVHGYES